MRRFGISGFSSAFGLGQPFWACVAACKVHGALSCRNKVDFMLVSPIELLLRLVSACDVPAGLVHVKSQQLGALGLHCGLRLLRFALRTFRRSSRLRIYGEMSPSPF